MKKITMISIVTSILIILTIGYFLIQIKPLNSLTSSNTKNLQISEELRRNQNSIENVSKENCISDECLAISTLEYPAGTLSQEAISALTLAIQDEYKAHATYQKVIDAFGMVRPFSMIIRAEENHISSLKSLFDKYDLPIPEDTWADKVSAPASIREACQIGVEAEIANANLYEEELLPPVTQYEDITSVFVNLMNASRDKHLVAFERCD